MFDNWAATKGHFTATRFDVQECIKISDLVSTQFLLAPSIQEDSAVADLEQGPRGGGGAGIPPLQFYG